MSERIQASLQASYRQHEQSDSNGTVADSLSKKMKAGSQVYECCNVIKPGLGET